MFKLRCKAFEIEGSSITEVVNRWFKLKPNFDDYSDIVIEDISEVPKAPKVLWRIESTASCAIVTNNYREFLCRNMDDAAWLVWLLNEKTPF